MEEVEADCFFEIDFWRPNKLTAWDWNGMRRSILKSNRLQDRFADRQIDREIVEKAIKEQDTKIKRWGMEHRLKLISMFWDLVDDLVSWYENVMCQVLFLSASSH